MFVAEDRAGPDEKLPPMRRAMVRKKVDMHVQKPEPAAEESVGRWPGCVGVLSVEEIEEAQGLKLMLLEKVINAGEN